MGRILGFFWAILGTGLFGGAHLWAEEAAFEITRVKIEEYIASRPVRTEDPMIRFERRYLTWGAITSEEFRDRQGKYYTVFWKTKDSGPVSMRFEYLQSKMGRAIQVQEVAVDRPKRGNNLVDFRVTGADYLEKGDVLAWKVSIVRNGVVLADKRSFLWKDP